MFTSKTSPSQDDSKWKWKKKGNGKRKKCFQKFFCCISDMLTSLIFQIIMIPLVLILALGLSLTITNFESSRSQITKLFIQKSRFEIHMAETSIKTNMENNEKFLNAMERVSNVFPNLFFGHHQDHNYKTLIDVLSSSLIGIQHPLAAGFCHNSSAYFMMIKGPFPPFILLSEQFENFLFLSSNKTLYQNASITGGLKVNKLKISDSSYIYSNLKLFPQWDCRNNNGYIYGRDVCTTDNEICSFKSQLSGGGLVTIYYIKRLLNSNGEFIGVFEVFQSVRFVNGILNDIISNEWDRGLNLISCLIDSSSGTLLGMSTSDVDMSIYSYDNVRTTNNGIVRSGALRLLSLYDNDFNNIYVNQSYPVIDFYANSTKYLMMFKSFKAFNKQYCIVLFIKSSDVFGEIDSIFYLSLVLSLSFLIICLFLSLLFSLCLVYPFIDLVNQSKKVGKMNFDNIKFVFYPFSELRRIKNGFKIMITMLNKYKSMLPSIVLSKIERRNSIHVSKHNAINDHDNHHNDSNSSRSSNLNSNSSGSNSSNSVDSNESFHSSSANSDEFDEEFEFCVRLKRMRNVLMLLKFHNVESILEKKKEEFLELHSKFAEECKRHIKHGVQLFRFDIDYFLFSHPMKSDKIIAEISKCLSVAINLKKCMEECLNDENSLKIKYSFLVFDKLCWIGNVGCETDKIPVVYSDFLSKSHDLIDVVRQNNSKIDNSIILLSNFDESEELASRFLLSPIGIRENKTSKNCKCIQICIGNIPKPRDGEWMYEYANKEKYETSQRAITMFNMIMNRGKYSEVNEFCKEFEKLGKHIEEFEIVEYSKKLLKKHCRLVKEENLKETFSEYMFENRENMENVIERDNFKFIIFENENVIELEIGDISASKRIL